VEEDVAVTDNTMIEALLNARLAELTARVRRAEHDLRQPLDADFEEQAVDLEDHQTLEGIESASLAEIGQIRLALARLAEGSYGVCTQCGGAIAPKRLEAVPTATRCIACARK
jgi:RNA polymerase-binding transcription factor DksA